MMKKPPLSSGAGVLANIVHDMGIVVFATKWSPWA
jgi:hypothetical protein